MSAKRNVAGPPGCPLSIARRDAVSIGAAVMLVACFAAVFAFGRGDTLAMVLWYAAACGFALWLASRHWMRDDRGAVAFVMLVAVALRVPAFVQPPGLSNDAYRYVWDGRLLLGGADPHAVTPLAPAAAALRHTWLWPHIDYRTIPTIYPPLALVLFAAAALDDRDLWGVKAVAEAGELALVAALLSVLRSRGLPRGRAAFYALQPLAALEFAGNGHIEAWAIAGIVAALTLSVKRPIYAAPLALAAAVLTKIYPLILAPVVFARNRGALVTTIAVVAAGYAPAVLSGHALGSSANYVAVQRFNGSIGSFFGTLGEIVIVLCVGFFAFRSVRRGGDIAVAALAVVLAYLLSSPNVLPWYALALPAILCVVPRPFSMPLRTLSLGIAGWTCSIAIAYGAGRFWSESDALGVTMRIVEYAPMYAALAAFAWRKRTPHVLQRTAT